MSAVWPLQSGTVINIHGLPYEVLGNVQVRGVVDPAEINHYRTAVEGKRQRMAELGMAMGAECGKIVADGQSARPESDRHETEMQASQQAHDAAMRRYDAKSGIIRDAIREHGGNNVDQVLAEADRLYAWLIESDEAAKERTAQPANPKRDEHMAAQAAIRAGFDQAARIVPFITAEMFVDGIKELRAAITINAAEFVVRDAVGAVFSAMWKAMPKA